MSRPTVSQARVIGAIYMLYFLAALPLSIRSAMVVPADAAATAANIIASESLYRLTIVTDLLGDALYLVLTGLIYWLLRPVNRIWATIAVLFSLTGCLVQVVSTVALMMPLVFLKDPNWHALALPARQELAFAAFRIYASGYTIGLFFFGFFDILMGVLFVAPRLIPRAIGWLLILAGIAWIVLVVTSLLSPPAVPLIQKVALPLGAVAELALALWLLVRGVNAATLRASDAQAAGFAG